MVSPSLPVTFPASDSVSPRHSDFDHRLPSGRPRIALLDGVPFTNHEVLAGRLIIDDPDDHESLYTTSQRFHGSAMASLIIHGDLSQPGTSARQPLYIRPILQPDEHNRLNEVVPPHELLVDLIHRAFTRIFEGDENRDPAAQSVRIVNLSIGDPARPFIRRLSPLARLLDRLASKYNVVIVVSAGNQASISPRLPANAVGSSDATKREIARWLHDTASLRRPLSPAESINCITVGASHEDRTDSDFPDNVVDVVPTGFPACFSPAGFGFRRSVKPEVLLPGGRQLFQKPDPTTEVPSELVGVNNPETPPGLHTAAPGLEGELKSTVWSFGTSNSAALATRQLNEIFDILESLDNQTDEFQFPNQLYHPVLAKALLVHAAEWYKVGGELPQLLDLTASERRRELARLLGYGTLRQERAAKARQNRALLLGAGSINDGRQHEFSYPLPRGLSGTTEWRRLTITLAWMSPINVYSQKYRVAKLQFEPPAAGIGVDRKEVPHNTVRNGTVQHEILEGNKVVAFMHNDSLSINVQCRAESGKLERAVHYGLAVSLEVGSTTSVDLHTQVRERLREEVRTRSRTRITPP
nr:S8 family peptidase [Haloechinothrix aidingensis]